MTRVSLFFYFLVDSFQQILFSLDPEFRLNVIPSWYKMTSGAQSSDGKVNTQKYAVIRMKGKEGSESSMYLKDHMCNTTYPVFLFVNHLSFLLLATWFPLGVGGEGGRGGLSTDASAGPPPILPVQFSFADTLVNVQVLSFSFLMLIACYFFFFKPFFRLFWGLVSRHSCLSRYNSTVNTV